MSNQHENGALGAPAALPQPEHHLAMLPPLWVAVTMLLSARAVWLSWGASFEYGLPDAVYPHLHATIATGIATILGGLYVLGLAWRGSRRFAAWYTAWQALVILVTVGLNLATLASEVFVVTLWSFATPAVEIAAAVACMFIAWRTRPVARPAREPSAPTGVYLIHGVLGAVVGAVLGAAIGTLGGGWLVSAADVSCFEGGCGYAVAAAVGVGMLLFAMVGAVVSVRQTRPG